MGKQGETAIIEMNIEIRNDGVQFDKIPVGGLFVYPAYSYSDCDVYMAVEEHNVDGDKVNAVYLSDGSLHDFNEEDYVRRIENANLVIG